MSEVELTEVRLPDLAMASGARIARWMVEPGESVAEGQSICEIETDKVDAELPSPAHGYFLGAVVDPGEVVACGAALGLIGEEPMDASDIEARLSVLRNEKVQPPQIPPPSQDAEPPKPEGLGAIFGLTLANLLLWALEIGDPVLYWIGFSVAITLAVISLVLWLRSSRRAQKPLEPS